MLIMISLAAIVHICFISFLRESIQTFFASVTSYLNGVIKKKHRLHVLTIQTKVNLETINHLFSLTLFFSMLFCHQPGYINRKNNHLVNNLRIAEESFINKNRYHHATTNFPCVVLYYYSTFH
jgi:hypothetical protein